MFVINRRTWNKDVCSTDDHARDKRKLLLSLVTSYQSRLEKDKKSKKLKDKKTTGRDFLQATLIPCQLLSEPVEKFGLICSCYWNIAEQNSATFYWIRNYGIFSTLILTDSICNGWQCFNQYQTSTTSGFKHSLDYILHLVQRRLLVKLSLVSILRTDFSLSEIMKRDAGSLKF